MEINKKQVLLLDCCLPDYFTGYHKPVLAIPAYQTMTCKEVAAEIRSEVNAIYDYLESGYTEEEINMFDAFADQLDTEGEDTFVGIEPKEGYTEEEDVENIEPTYLYFAIATPVHRHGITFLNE